MEEGVLLLKSATFLTSLVKSKNADSYYADGFTLEDIKQETISVLQAGEPISEARMNKFIEQVEKESPHMVDCLLKEKLIKQKGDRFFFTSNSVELADFMVELSSIMTAMHKDYYKGSNPPYRNYPGSSQVYGLN